MIGAFCRRVGSPAVGGAAVVLVVVAMAGVTPAGASVIHRKEGSFNGAETPGGPFAGMVFTDAVQQSNNDVWVAEGNFFEVLGHNIVDKFNEEGVYQGVQITGAETSQGSFKLSISEAATGAGVAVDNSPGGKGELYVADTGNHVVDRFSEAGSFECQIAGAETEAALPSAKECGASGSELAGAIEPGGVAVDGGGEVFVTDDLHGVIDVFEASGKLARQIKDPHLSNVLGAIALDKEGDLYVASAGAVVKFDSTGTFVAVLVAEKAFGVSVDPKTSHVYVSLTSPSELAEYEPSGALVGVTPINETNIAGSAVDGATGKIYVTEPGLFGGSSVAVFSGDLVVPNVTTGAATEVGETSVALSGHVDPDAAHGGGEVVECKFEYGPTTGYGQVAPCTPPPPLAAAADVSAAIGGLKPSTAYDYRLTAANSSAVPGVGADGTFTTEGPPGIDAEFVHVNGTDVTLRALINPFHLDTTCQLQYVDEATFQQSGYAGATTLPCAPADIGAGLGDQGVTVSIPGLPVGTTYHYRFVGRNKGGITEAADNTFSTFGANNVKFEVVDKENQPFTQAAGHPYELRTSFKLNGYKRRPGEITGASSEGVDGNVKDIVNQLPVGLLGNPAAVPRCTRSQLLKSQCAGADQVGWLSLDLEGEVGPRDRLGLFNLVPPKGKIAEFGVTVLGIVNIYIDIRLRSGDDYGVTAESANNSALAGVSEVYLGFWGVPADPSHDPERFCGRVHPCSAETPLRPFLRNPTSCVGPLSVGYAFDSWQTLGDFAETTLGLPAITGCEKVPFSPAIDVRPTTSAADSPSGLHVDVHLPQNEAPQGLAESDLKDTTITLPAGLVVNPSAADGLVGCSEAQAGFTGFKELDPASEPGVRTAQFTPSPVTCPDASKLGRIEIHTPVIDHVLPGAIYLARQGENPFGSLLGVYLAVYDPITGIVIKLAAHLEADPLTGQLTTVVDQAPQLPFEDFKVELFEGSRAPLTTPLTCGTFTTTSSLAPWNGSGALTPSSSFEVGEAPAGGACASTPGEEPDARSFAAGAFTPLAGAFSPFVLQLGREDGSQQLAGFSVTLPPGLLGRIAGVQECPQTDVEAAQRRSGLGEGSLELANPSCPAASELGVVHVGVGSGTPYHASGRAYLAGPYEGAPFSIVAITPALAGPFDLGVVVVRSALFVDRATAQVTVRTDPLPTILDGIPLDIRSIDVEVTRSGFMLNPTSCNKLAITGTVASTTGANAGISSPFQVGGCTNLPFKPSFIASTAGHASRAEGASLNVRVTQVPGEANVAKVDVQLPAQLPARLKTLQKACTEAQFNANPAGCPAASRVAYATVHTPLLNSPLSGPAYFVSHGNAAFPNLDIVLEGEGVTIVLVGDTQIKDGITYSRFEAAPDAPFSSFELTAPQGPDSIFATNLPGGRNNLCGHTLTMPTILVGQNGVVFKQQTPLAVTGCAAARAHTHRRASSRTQRLSRALAACRRHNKGVRARRRREACERRARARYAQAKHTHRQKRG